MDFANIRALTSTIQEKIGSGTLDSPSWDLIRTAKLAARMYAPLGTMMTLGDHVRIIRTFLEAFKAVQNELSPEKESDVQELRELQADLKVPYLQFPHQMHSLTIKQVISRPTSKMGHQGRPDTTTITSSHYPFQVAGPTHMGAMFVRDLASRVNSLGPDLRRHLLCRT